MATKIPGWQSGKTVEPYTDIDTQTDGICGIDAFRVPGGVFEGIDGWDG